MLRRFGYGLLFALLLSSSVLAETTHKVRKGETLSEIAKAYRITVKSIKDANGLRNANRIKSGQILKIPATAPRIVEYKIRKGDSLSEIAKRHGATLKQVTSYNNIRNPNKIKVGQVIKIPVKDGVPLPADQSPQLTNSVRRTLDSIRVGTSKWKHIVIHHSATKVGSPKGLDRFHREERNMENGLAYHFLIGNGRGMVDGEVYVADRWKRQIQGGHLSSYAMNSVSIGICLVGDFERSKPTEKQMEQLIALIEYLVHKTDIPVGRVTTHTLINAKPTLCPGRHFPTKSFKKTISKL